MATNRRAWPRSGGVRGGGAVDANVRILHEHDDVGPADADMVQAAGDAEGDDAGGVDAVAADAVVGMAGLGVTRPARARYRLMVAAETRGL